MKRALFLLVGLAMAAAAQADAADTLREFVREVKAGRAAFTQTVTGPEGVQRRPRSGSFEFQRPNRFRFAYAKPFEQLIVADGQKVWIYDPDLEQASSRRIAQALGSTPAALLAGGSLEADFELKPDGSRDGMDWALAVPKARDGAFQSLRVGFKGRELAALEITDSMGQRSVLRFEGFTALPSLPAERFRFVPPAGVDVIEQ